MRQLHNVYDIWLHHHTKLCNMLYWLVLLASMSRGGDPLWVITSPLNTYKRLHVYGHVAFATNIWKYDVILTHVCSFRPLWSTIHPNSDMSCSVLTNNEENYLRVVRVVLEDAPTHLRVLFKNRYQQKYNRQWDDTPASGQYLIAHSNTRNALPHVIDVVKHGDSSLFDVTVLCWCLLSSGCQIVPPSNTGGAISDRQLVIGIRKMRNDVVHSNTGTLSNAEFNHTKGLLNAFYTQLHWSTIIMKGMLEDPLITAECLRIVRLLQTERQRYTVLDRKLEDTVQKLEEQISK